MTDLTTDVLTVGAGPCGLMLANELGRRDVPHLLIDAKEGTAFNPQANATQARTMEHFRRLGFAHEIRAQGLPGDHPTDIAYFTRLCTHELARLRLPTAAQAVQQIRSMAGSWSAAELPHRVAQKYVEATLLQHAQRHASNDIRFNHRLLDFADHGDHVSARVVPVQGGKPYTVKARYLIGADGARSPVRKALGLEWGGAQVRKRSYMGGQMFAVYLRSPAIHEALMQRRAWMYVSINSQRRALLATVDGKGEFAFHAAVHDGEDADAWTDADARRVVHQTLGRELDLEVLSCRTWMAGHSLVAQSFGRGRVFIAGDAAHLFTPTGGLGYNTAVEDAVNLGWKLASVLRGASHERLLESYAAERQPVARRNTTYARQFADSIGLFEVSPNLENENAAGDAARAAAARYLQDHARREFNIPGVTFGARYDHSPLIVTDSTQAPPDQANSYIASACPGGRPPHVWLEDGRSLFDSFHSEWTLLSLGLPAVAAEPFVAAASALGLDLRVVAHPSNALRDLYQAPLALIRPDQIVGWRGASAQDALAVLRQAACALGSFA